MDSNGFRRTYIHTYNYLKNYSLKERVFLWFFLFFVEFIFSVNLKRRIYGKNIGCDGKRRSLGCV